MLLIPPAVFMVLWDTVTGKHGDGAPGLGPEAFVSSVSVLYLLNYMTGPHEPSCQTGNVETHRLCAVPYPEPMTLKSSENVNIF